MSNIPFSVYDFFGYLAAGLVVLAAVDFGFFAGDGLSAQFGLAATLLWLVIIYVIGHIVAAFASLIFEDGFVRRVLLAPEITLFRDKPSNWRGTLFPGYYRSFEVATRSRINDKSTIKEPGRAQFLQCWGKVMGDARFAARLDTFLNLYGFSRNTSLAAILAAIALLMGVAVNTKLGGAYAWPRVGWAIGALFAAVALLYRYLKFFRHYTLQVFVLFAEMP